MVQQKTAAKEKEEVLPHKTVPSSSPSLLPKASPPQKQSFQTPPQPSGEIQWPEQGEIVVVTISKILDYGVFCDMMEYPGLKGFVHLSNIATSWIKNIRNFVKENQVRAAQVQRVDKFKNQIDLSFTKVSADMQRRKLNEFKQTKRSQKLIETLAKQNKKTYEEVWKEVAEPLAAKYGSIGIAFEEIASKGESIVSDAKIPEKWRASLLELVKKNIILQKKEIKGAFKAVLYDSDGIEFIKKVFTVLEKAKDSIIEFYYLGSGKYMIKIQAPDFKSAEKTLSAIKERVTKEFKKVNGTVEFERLENN